MVKSDENMFNSIIRNLVNNAIKFSPENSMVSVHAVDSGEMVTIEVKDQGSGIPEANLSGIFSGFSSKSLENAKGKGSGLGLILCREFVEANHGKIWVQSEEGKGSSFYFTLNKA
jgi:signal transduction histidine kinase